MSVPAEPPERVAHLVRSTPGEVRFRSVRKQSVLGGLGLLGGVGTAWMAWFLIAILASVGASGFRAEEVVGSVVWLTIVGAMSGGGLGLLLGMSGRDLVVGEGSMRYTGVLPPAADRPVQLVLTGSPGHPMVLESESQILAKLFPSASQRGWDFDSVTWLGQRVSDLLGVRIRDERPEAEWRRWASDPLYRAQKQFDALLSKNQTEFHAHHATEPDPPAHSSDVDGMRIALDTGLFSMSVLKITPTHLIVDNRRYRLDSITRAGVAYRLVKTKNSRTWYGRLQVLVDGRVKTLVNLRVERHGGRKAAALNWLAATIAEHAGNARDLGSAEDVPEDLARIVRPAVLEGLVKRFVPLALALASCGPSLEIDPGCEVELASRPRIEGDTIVVEVWVTAFYETRAIDIPSCALISIDDRPALPCGDDGLPDPSGCQPALFDLRGDTSVQVAQIEIPLAGDACNEPLEPGAYPVGIHGIETGDYEVCQRLGVLVVP